MNVVYSRAVYSDWNICRIQIFQALDLWRQLTAEYTWYSVAVVIALALCFDWNEHTGMCLSHVLSKTSFYALF